MHTLCTRTLSALAYDRARNPTLTADLTRPDRHVVTGRGRGQDGSHD